MTELEPKIEAIERELSDENYETNDEGLLVLKEFTGIYKRNPYGASGIVADPRMNVCWEEYIRLMRAGTPSASKAALKAGYAPNTASQITNMKWFKDRKAKLRRSTMFSKAERNLGRALDTSYTYQVLVDGEWVTKISPDIMRIVVDVSKTIVTTLGKESYSTRVEQTGAAGKDLPTPILNILVPNSPNLPSTPINEEITIIKEEPNAIYINNSDDTNTESDEKN